MDGSERLSVVVAEDGALMRDGLVAQLRSAGTASLCVQTETAPYKYVVVEGTVSVDDGVDSSWRRDVARHYLGNELGDMYADATAESEPTAVTVRLTPSRWRTTDFGKQWA